MNAPLPPVSIGHLVLPLADAAAAELAAGALRDEMARLWQVDRAAGLAWGTSLDTVVLDGAVDETPESLGGRLAGTIRARLVRGPLG
jgi:hypothetical protein